MVWLMVVFGIIANQSVNVETVASRSVVEDLNFLLISRRTASIRWIVGFGDGEKEYWKLVWRSSASSMVICFSDLKISSFTASAHSPHIQRPLWLALTLAMYSTVHSSVNSQHSHFANSTTDPSTSPAWCWSSLFLTSVLVITAVKIQSFSNKQTNKNSSRDQNLPSFVLGRRNRCNLFFFLACFLSQLICVVTLRLDLLNLNVLSSNETVIIGFNKKKRLTAILCIT